jgi:hypothetical protein
MLLVFRAALKDLVNAIRPVDERLGVCLISPQLDGLAHLKPFAHVPDLNSEVWGWIPTTTDLSRVTQAGVCRGLPLESSRRLLEIDRFASTDDLTA